MNSPSRQKPPARRLTELEKSERQGWIDMAWWLAMFLVLGALLAVVKIFWKNHGGQDTGLM